MHFWVNRYLKNPAQKTFFMSVHLLLSLSLENIESSDFFVFMIVFNTAFQGSNCTQGLGLQSVVVV